MAVFVGQRNSTDGIFHWNEVPICQPVWNTGQLVTNVLYVLHMQLRKSITTERQAMNDDQCWSQHGCMYCTTPRESLWQATPAYIWAVLCLGQRVSQ